MPERCVKVELCTKSICGAHIQTEMQNTLIPLNPTMPISPFSPLRPERPSFPGRP